MMNLADEYGFLVINEVPAVGMHWWDDYNFAPDKVNAETAVVHKELIRQLMERDKNHPSIVMFSVANEPATHEEAAGEYFRDVISYTRTVCDLPLTLVEFPGLRGITSKNGTPSQMRTKLPPALAKAVSHSL